jgi:hypothetical protein
MAVSLLPLFVVVYLVLVAWERNKVEQPPTYRRFYELYPDRKPR